MALLFDGAAANAVSFKYTIHDEAQFIWKGVTGTLNIKFFIEGDDQALPATWPTVFTTTDATGSQLIGAPRKTNIIVGEHTGVAPTALTLEAKTTEPTHFDPFARITDDGSERSTDDGSTRVVQLT